VFQHSLFAVSRSATGAGEGGHAPLKRHLDWRTVPLLNLSVRDADIHTAAAGRAACTVPARPPPMDATALAGPCLRAAGWRRSR
jgi:hypothetical protein